MTTQNHTDQNAKVLLQTLVYASIFASGSAFTAGVQTDPAMLIASAGCILSALFFNYIKKLIEKTS